MADRPIRERVIKILEDASGYEGVKPMDESKRLVDDLNFDSLDMVETVMDLEDEFDIRISNEDAEKWVTVGDVVKHIEGAHQI